MRSVHHLLAHVALALAVLVGAIGCGATGPAEEEAVTQQRPVVVATTSVLGDVVTRLSGGQFDVVSIMPAGADPHLFQPSAQDVALIAKASAVIANGAEFEEGLLDALHAAEERGAAVFEAITAVAPLAGVGGSDDDHGDDDHGDDDHGDDDHGDDDHGDDDHGDDDHGDDDHGEHGDGDGWLDPHFFTDPARMSDAVGEITAFLITQLDTIDADQLAADSAAYVAELNALDEEVEQLLSSVPQARRVLITNHQVFSYFADRYNFEVIGTVVPLGSSDDGVSGRRIAELAALLEREGVDVVFADRSSSSDVAETLANEVGDVDVVKLFTESLGGDGSGGETYIEMVRGNALAIASALAE